MTTDNTDTAPQTGTLAAISPELREYAELLMTSGFTVYAPAPTDTRAMRAPLGFFHYSREVDGKTCYGTVQRGYFGEVDHSMPLTPSRLNGSGAHIGGRWGDAETLGLDQLDPLTVEYARAVARPANWCPFNAEPTREATERANRGNAGVPQRYYRGAVLQNAEPWGIGTSYLPVA